MKRKRKIAAGVIIVLSVVLYVRYWIKLNEEKKLKDSPANQQLDYPEF